MKELDGELEAYWEQGWEGRIEYAFQFDGNQEPFILKNGQHLTIYAQNGDILWEGLITINLARVFGLGLNKKMFPTLIGWTGSGANRRLRQNLSLRNK